MSVLLIRYRESADLYIALAVFLIIWVMSAKKQFCLTQGKRLRDVCTWVFLLVCECMYLSVCEFICLLSLRLCLRFFSVFLHVRWQLSFFFHCPPACLVCLFVWVCDCLPAMWVYQFVWIRMYKLICELVICLYPSLYMCLSLSSFVDLSVGVPLSCYCSVYVCLCVWRHVGLSSNCKV